MQLTLNLPKRRNPLAVLARRRHAGSHRLAATSVRQRALRALMRELDTMKSSIP